MHTYHTCKNLCNEINCFDKISQIFPQQKYLVDHIKTITLFNFRNHSKNWLQHTLDYSLTLKDPSFPNIPTPQCNFKFNVYLVYYIMFPNYSSLVRHSMGVKVGEEAQSTHSPPSCLCHVLFVYHGMSCSRECSKLFCHLNLKSV